MPKDVLDLGRHLVRELGLEDSVDTLGRWTAHHLAELIDEAENAPTAAARQDAQTAAVETILKLWERRQSLPGRAYPVSKYQDILVALERLRPSSNPFTYLSDSSGARKDLLAASLFDDLTRLIVALLLIEYPPGAEDLDVDGSAYKALSDVERHVVDALGEWVELFRSTDTKGVESPQEHDRVQSGPIELGEVVDRAIKSIETTLAQLQAEVE